MTYEQVKAIKPYTIPQTLPFEFQLTLASEANLLKVNYLVQFGEELNEVMLPCNVSISIIDFTYEGELFEPDSSVSDDNRICGWILNLIYHDPKWLSELERQLWMNYQAQSDCGNLKKSALTWLL